MAVAFDVGQTNPFTVTNAATNPFINNVSVNPAPVENKAVKEFKNQVNPDSVASATKTKYQGNNLDIGGDYTAKSTGGSDGTATTAYSFGSGTYTACSASSSGSSGGGGGTATTA